MLNDFQGNSQNIYRCIINESNNIRSDLGYRQSLARNQRLIVLLCLRLSLKKWTSLLPYNEDDSNITRGYSQIHSSKVEN
jgi:hypothetical protein